MYSHRSWVNCVVATLFVAVSTAADGQGTCEDGADFYGAACNLCLRNEMYVQATNTCVCPDSDKDCGNVTPFDNDVITIACFISTAAIVFHVIHDSVQRYLGNSPATASQGTSSSYKQLIPDNVSLRRSKKLFRGSVR